MRKNRTSACSQTRTSRSTRTLLLLALAAGTARCATAPLPTPHAPFPEASADVTLQVEVAVDGEQRILTLPLEQYVAGSVPAEMPLNEPDTAVADRLARLQAILARTYALANRGRHAHEGFDLCSTTHCQVYIPQERQPVAVARLVAAAVEQTHGQIITDGHGPIQALFHADCGGHTSSATDVWGGPAPEYLVGVRDSFCVTVPNTDWHLTLNRDHLRRILNTSQDTAIGQRLDQIAVVSRDRSGRAISISVVGDERRVIQGERLRAVIGEQLGPRAFRSTRFRVEQQADRILFSGQGFGHGVGLCQTGAIVQARHGEPVRAILAHYYPGTWLEPRPGATTRLSTANSRLRRVVARR
ncbi:MAG: SpoIID/LytB domain-containing protein [Vicinamibacterales bacterium]|nr:SpoIID/LytB domain-containing protein [Vicinamibacterales bacterium]HJN45788.1 SpoIID/LytB domain-containing protein [Vicinamibacterales bacterium]